MRWSYSSLNQFETCPLQYAAERVYKTIERPSNPQSDWGIAVHEALEKRLRSKAPLASQYEQYEKLVAVVEKLEGDKFYEYEVALTRERKVVAWDAKDVWVRNIIDVLVVKDSIAIVIDWKTGKIKKDSSQLALYALIVFATFPKVLSVVTIFSWVKFSKADRWTFHRDDVEELWQPFLERVASLEEAFFLDIWVPRPSGLCKKHCANTECEFHGVGNRRY